MASTEIQSQEKPLDAATISIVAHRIPITGLKGAGLFALVSAEDAESVQKHKWHLGAQGYPVANLNRTAITLHRFIVGDTGKLSVDHINRNKLDNRRCNLRTASRAQNQANRKTSSHSKQPYKGVRQVGKRWQSRIRIMGREINLGSYLTPEQAAAAYDSALISRHGEYAFTNSMMKEAE